MAEKKSEKEDTEKSKTKLTRQKIFLIVVMVAGVVLTSYAIYSYFTSPSDIEFHYATALGQVWAFRSDLREAEKVKVEPSEQTVYLELFSFGDSPFVENITIAYKDAGEKENVYYQLQILELVTKLKTIYNLRYDGQSPTFNAVEVDSYYKLPGKIKNPIIALVHPKFATETSIKLENHVILLNAKTQDDMDLVATKLLMIALQLKRIS